MKEEVTVGEAHMAGGRAVVPIVRSVLCSWEGGAYLAAEPVAIVVAGPDGALLVGHAGEDVAGDRVREAVERAYAALHAGTE
ncbi:MAG: hypothetical protein PHP59_08870 [Methanofollis sp.]|uniref:hypothetical protein n=1 Tax=Methanofollis sp. TaxID=2052835 RepID=UPI00261067DD|nr:hypothetical protein [Methanofollis sp.]MDD4255471.1 hypothetical protein [Methanofollis sp.]